MGGIIASPVVRWISETILRESLLMVDFTFERVIEHKFESWDDDVECWFVTIEVGRISVMNGIYSDSLDWLGFLWSHRNIAGASLCLVWRLTIYLSILSRYFWYNNSLGLMFEIIGRSITLYLYSMKIMMCHHRFES